MLNENAIEVIDISKKFCRKLQKQMWYGMRDIARNVLGIQQDLNKLRKDEFWAIKNVSFSAKKGESLGLIGLNGSGKSTILKMINGIFMPDIGEIRVKGKVGALIEAGAGFHPYLTGRENIYLNGTILGMSKKTIDDKFNEIVKFSEVGEFLDMPLKNYSSGMYVRLGFAVAAHLSTDILLIDEILAVGDIEFQQKCFSKIDTMKKNGTTIIFISHNIDNIKRICNRCVLLDHGQVRMDGAVDKVLNLYGKSN
jgi:lipopolysaccharide transport system ATP-binding protein